MNKRLKIGAALLALAILPAAAFLFHMPAIHIFALLSGVGLVGTATITYASFADGSGPHNGYTGGATAPTQAQSSTVNAVVAQILAGDTDTTALLTHNLNLTTAQVAALQPYISIYVAAFTAAIASAAAPVYSWVLGANTLTMTKQSLTGSGGTYIVTIRRPWSASS